MVSPRTVFPGTSWLVKSFGGRVSPAEPHGSNPFRGTADVNERCGTFWGLGVIYPHAETTYAVNMGGLKS